MGQKEKIKGLVSDYFGEQPKEKEHLPTTAQRRELTAEEVKIYEITPEQEERLNAKRLQKAGRPLGSVTGKAKGRGLRATFIISNPETLTELKYIALADTKLYKDVVNEALTSYVKEWKERNGEIRLTTKN